MKVQKKYTKQKANYRKAKFTSKNNCGNCEFLNNYKCSIVDGKISVFYVCKLHRKKTNWIN